MARSLRETILSLPPYHLISWGSLLGMQLYQSFTLTKLCYLYLPRPQFNSLQKKVFPVYFSLQLGLVVLTALTYPPRSLLSIVERNGCWNEAVPLGVNAAMAALNLWVYGPRTMRGMTERVYQETKDSRKSLLDSPSPQNDPLQKTDSRAIRPVSDEMKHLNRAFSRSHAMAIHLNAIAMLATVWYGFALAARMSID